VWNLSTILQEKETNEILDWKVMAFKKKQCEDKN
jgi:hypothetical protein